MHSVQKNFPPTLGRQASQVTVAMGGASGSTSNSQVALQPHDHRSPVPGLFHFKYLIMKKFKHTFNT